MIPGLKPVPAFLSSGSAAAGTQLSVVSATTSTSATIAWPSVQAGDLAILSDSAYTSSSTPSDVVPTGFTGIDTIGGASVRWRGSYKKCTGSESGSITGMGGSPVDSKVLLIIRSTGTINTITPSTFDMQLTTASPSQRTIAANFGTAPLIVLGVAFSSGSNPSWTTQSPSWQATASPARSNVGYRIYNTNPVVAQTIKMGDGGVNIMVGGYIQVA